MQHTRRSSGSIEQTTLPLVSIITPNFNRAALLADTIECVRSQTYARIEHIVVDAASEDGSVQILQHWEKQAGIKWISEPDTGMYDALNKGLRLAAGDVLAYLNTDDRYFPYSVETAVDALLSNPELGFVYSDMLNFDESRKRGSIYFYPPFDADYFRRGGVVGQPTVFWRRAVTNIHGGFDDALRLGADMEYWAKISQTHSGRRLEEVLAYEGQHDQRLTSGGEARVQGLEELQLIKDRYYAGWRSRGPLVKISDAVREGIRYRYVAGRFLWFSARPARGTPGDRWQGFLQQSDTFQVNRSRLAAALLPYVGRRFKDFIEAAP